jgi:hypothetical protein
MRRRTSMARRTALAAATLGMVVATVAVATPAPSGAESAPPAGTSTAAALKAASWSSNVSVSAGSTTVTISSNGVPSTTYWTRPSEYAVPDAGVVVPTKKTAHVAPDPTQVVPISLSVPSVPTWSATTTPTAGGPIGILLSGAPLYDPYEGNGTTVALAANFFLKDSEGDKVYFVDGCNGHPGPMGAYHYHGLPTCITSKIDTATGPSHILGVALDGYPVYGDRSMSGALIKPSQLDACNGIFSPTPEFPNGIYHYVLLDVKSSRSSLRCYHGVVSTVHSNFKNPVYLCGLTLAQMFRAEHPTTPTEPVVDRSDKS